MKVGPFTDGERDRDWLPEDIWASIPQYLHRSIEGYAARHRLAVLASMPTPPASTIDPQAERTAIVEFLASKAAELKAQVRRFVEMRADGRHTLPVDMLDDLIRFYRHQTGAYIEAAIAIRQEAHLTPRPPADAS